MARLHLYYLRLLGEDRSTSDLTKGEIGLMPDDRAHEGDSTSTGQPLHKLFLALQHSMQEGIRTRSIAEARLQVVGMKDVGIRAVTLKGWYSRLAANGKRVLWIVKIVASSHVSEF